MSKRKRDAAIEPLSRRLVVFVGLTLILLLVGTSAGLAQEDAPFVRLVRTIEPDELGMSSPAGLAFSPAAGVFYVVEAREPGRSLAQSSDIAVVAASPVDDQGGMVRVMTAVSDPLNMAFDGKAGRLLLFQPATLELVDIAAGADGELDSTTLTRHSVPRFGLRNPQGMAVDPASGQLFLLDGIGPRIVRVEPDSDGGFDSAVIARLDLVDTNMPGLRGLAFNPANGHLYTLNPAQQTLYELTQSGRLVASHDLSSFGLSDPQGLVFAPTGDLTDDPSLTSLYIADAGLAGGQILELALDQVAPLAIEADVTATLVQTIDTSGWITPSPDPAGITYIPDAGTLLMSDSEVDEMPMYYTGDNVYELTLDGSLLRTESADPAEEPSGLAHDPIGDRIFIADDNWREVWEYHPGGDGVYLTSDDVRTWFRADDFGIGDPEGIAYDTWNGVLFLADGLNSEVYRLEAGGDGEFGTGDDVVTNWDTATPAIGMVDPAGIVFNPENGHLYLVGRPRDTMAQVRINASDDLVLVRTIDTSATSAIAPGGVTLAPGSQDPGVMNFYMTDRGIDNGFDPWENDGKIYEMYVPALEPDVAIAKTVDPAVAVPGGIIAYTLTFSNAGGGTATDVVITDLIPPELTVQSVSSSGATIVDSGADPPYVWNVEDLSPAEEGVIVVTAEVTSTLSCFDTFTNEATIATSSSDTRPGNDSSSVIMAAGAGVSVDPSSASKSANPGVPVNYTLQVNNDGTCDDTYNISVSGTASTVTGPTTVAVDAGTSQDVQMTVWVPSEAGCGSETATVTFTSQNAGSVSASSELVTTVNTVYGLEVEPLTDALSGIPGAELPYTLRVTNIGNCADTFNLAASVPNWITDAPVTVGPLLPDLGYDVDVIATVPLDALCTDQDITTLTFTSSDGTTSAASILTSSAVPVYEVMVEPATDASSANPGEDAPYTLRVTNIGNCSDTFDSSVAGDVWPASVLPTEVTLAPDAYADVDVAVTVPPGAQCAASDSATVTFTSSDDTASDWSILTTSVSTVRSVSVVPPAPALSGNQGSAVIYTLWVLNEGNCIDTFDVAVSGTSWSVFPQYTQMVLNPNEQKSVDVTVQIPPAAPCGPETATVTFTSSDGITSDASLLTTTVNSVFEVMVEPSSDSLSVDRGTDAAYTLRVTNLGNCSDTFNFSATGDQWPASALPTSVTLAQDAYADVDVSVAVPWDARCGESDIATVTFTSSGVGSPSDSSELTTSVNTAYGVTVEPSSDAASGHPDTDVLYTLWVTNTGNCSDTFDRSISGNTWTVSPVTSVGPLDPDAGAPVDVAVSVPACTLGGVSDAATVTFISQNHGTTTGSAALTTTADQVAPAARDDQYDVPEDGTRVVAAPGVLVNDSDANCEPLTVSTHTLPAHGTLSLAPDGSFAYTPTLNFHGVDIFTYDASDGSLADTATVTITVTSAGDDPIVDAGPDQPASGEPPIEEGDLVSFSGSFTDPARATLFAEEDLHWDFGDGNSETGTLTPDHTYLDNDVYIVTLTVTDVNGDVGQDWLTVTVLNVVPEVDAGPDQRPEPGELISFTGIFTDTAADTHTIQWDLDDGTIIDDILEFDHAFDAPGDYTVTLTVTDDDGGVGIDTAIISVRLKVYLPIIFR